jgi:hypothetical protein
MSIAGIFENNKVIVPFVAPMEIKSNTPVFGQDSLSLKRYVSRRGKAQRWEITTNLMPTNNSADFLTHNIVNNSSKVVDILMPQLLLSNFSTYQGVVRVTSDTLPGVTEVNVTFLNGTGTLVKGEFVQFSNHDKIYLVTETRQNSGLIKIFPELRIAVDNNTTLKYRNNGQVILRAFYDLDTIFGIKFVDGILSDPGSITFVEAL